MQEMIFFKDYPRDSETLEGLEFDECLEILKNKLNTLRLKNPGFRVETFKLEYNGGDYSIELKIFKN